METMNPNVSLADPNWPQSSSYCFQIHLLPSLRITLFLEMDFSRIIALAAGQAPKPSLEESLASYDRRDGSALIKLWKEYENANNQMNT